MLPADHVVDDDAAFAAAIATALDAPSARAGRVVLLGIEAGSAETEYGWIEPDTQQAPVDGDAVMSIRRFWEKPSPELAGTLLSRGCLWNSFVMVGRVTSFIELIGAGTPTLVRAMAPLRRALGTAREAEVAERVYAGLPDLNFSERVLVPAAGRLGVMRVKGVEWSDWGNAGRVLATLRRTGWRPAWLSRVALAS